MKIVELLNKVDVLKDITKKEMPVKASYAIAKNIGKIDAELKTFEAERAKLIKKYGTEKDGNYEVEDREGFGKEFNELLEVEITLDFHKFNIEALGDCNITPAEIMALEEMLEDE